MKIKEKFKKDKIWFTSDLHFGHDNILKFCHRPFIDIMEHDSTLISNWNSIVKEDDDVFICGDLIFNTSVNELRNILSLLNGRKWLILGNHDYKQDLHKDKYKQLFDGRVMDIAEITVLDEDVIDGKQRIFLSHYPHEFWPAHTLHGFGHVHSGPISTASEVTVKKVGRHDVGVDNNNLYPISYSEFKAKCLAA